MTVIGTKFSKYLYLFILSALVAAIAAAGYAFEQQQKRIAIEEARLVLATIADFKATQIVEWRRERLNEANSLYFNTMMSHRIQEHLNNTKDASGYEELNSWMKQLRDASGYANVVLFRPNTELITSTSPDTSPANPHYQNQVRTAARTQKILFSDLHYDPDTNRININLVIPLMSRNNGPDSCVAVLLIDIDPNKYLYSLIRTWPAPSSSGETVLVRRDGNDALYLNTLRFRTDAALKFRVSLNHPQMPAVRAVLGQEGVFDGVDYRGVPVLAALRTIPDSPWAIVTKTDTREILAPVSKRFGYVVATCLIILITLVLAISLWWRRKREAYLYTQYETELKYNHELKQAEQSLQDANLQLEERVASRTAELSDSNSKLRQEIAERKQVEELLRNHFQAIRQSPVAIIMTDLDGTIQYVNPKFCEYSGYSYEEAIGQNPRILKTEVTTPETHKRLWETITAGLVWEGKFCNRKKNGELFWEYAKILPLKDQDGNITSFMAFKEDITRHRLLEEKLLRARKLETIGQIAGGVAHEVRNPLNAILSITEALFKEKEIEDNLEFTPYIQHIRTQVNRLAHLMNELLDLGKTTPTSSIQPVALHECCRETIELWNTSGSAQKIPVLLTTDSGLMKARVMADRERLVQIIFNLLENAAQHSPGSSKIIVHLVETPSASVQQGPTAIIRISDAGCGIPPENLSHIFDPFYTGRRGGTGLGLALVKHFVEDMNGTVIIFNNDPPPGCSAEVQIPAPKTG